ncbi:MAG: hypothetical protein ACLQAH_16435 [Limisphaerales bacterium]
MVKAAQRTIQKDGRELQGVDFTVAVRPDDTVETQFGLMVDMLYQWHGKFGKACAECSVSFIGTPQNHEAFMACLLALVRQEEPLRPLFARLGQMDVTFVSPEGKILKESELKLQ